jgi:hypothetical protein
MEMMRLARARGVQTIITIRSSSQPAVIAVVTPIVHSRQMYALEGHLGPLKIQPPFCQGLRTLGSVKRDQHNLL